MNWYYIPEKDLTAIFICPTFKTKFKNQWLCAVMDPDGDFRFFQNFSARYMRKINLKDGTRMRSWGNNDGPVRNKSQDFMRYILTDILEENSSYLEELKRYL
jgi:hypothetical protein